MFFLPLPFRCYVTKKPGMLSATSCTYTPASYQRKTGVHEPLGTPYPRKSGHLSNQCHTNGLISLLKVMPSTTNGKRGCGKQGYWKDSGTVEIVDIDGGMYHQRTAQTVVHIRTTLFTTRSRSKMTSTCFLGMPMVFLPTVRKGL